MSMLTDTQAALTRANARIKQLEIGLDAAKKQMERDSITANQRYLKAIDLPYSRTDFEEVSRAKLLSLIEQASAESRRRGMKEAEALIQRHMEMNRETDIQLMQGVVDSYTARIKEVRAIEERRALEALAKTKEQPKPATPEPWSKNYVTPADAARTAFKNKNAWWSDDSEGFVAFDNRARKIAEASKKSGTLEDGKSTTVPGDNGGTYVLSRAGEVVSCTCPSWQFNKAVADRRTCKHLKRYLGVLAEENRITRPQPSCWCGVLLIRGQCQVHTQNWAGDERCNCGRLFSFCKEEYRTGHSATKAWHTPRIQGTPEPVHK